MARWVLANACEVLRQEVNRRWPGRDKASDGTVADDKHSITSDHSPANPKHFGVVTAIDIDAGVGGHVGKAVWDLIVEGRDPRVKYAIYRGMMVRSYSKPGIPAWVPSIYRGANGHFTHIHVSMKDTPELYDDDRPWGIWAPGAESQEDDDVVKRGDEGGDVAYWQRRLNDALGTNLAVDGVFGPKTEERVRYAQQLGGLEQTGIIGLTTGVYIQALAHGKRTHDGAA